jgi:hypothetical protein
MAAKKATPKKGKKKKALKASSLIIRKSTSAMSSAEWDKLKSAISALIANGKYRVLVNIHHDMKHHMHSMMSMHGMPMSDPKGRLRFLPWHRAFVHQLEKELQAIDSSLFVPYWNWITDRSFPAQLLNFLGLSPGRNNPFPSPNYLPKQNSNVALPQSLGGFQMDSMNSILASADYLSFTDSIEGGPHNGVHNWVGGAMSDPTISPEDPIFWMHHANIDRLWNIWQGNNPGKISPATGNVRILDPWNSETIDNVNDIAALGYSYQ